MTTLTVQPRLSAPVSWVARVLGQTFAGWGARLGLLWLMVMLLAAVFAPFLANSHPYVVRGADGTLSFPLFIHLKPIDVALPTLAVAAMLLWTMRRRLPGSLAFGAWLVLTAAVLTGCFLGIKPPLRESLAEHRTRVRLGEVAWSLSAPVAYSPRDRQRDLEQRRYIAPSLAGPHLMGTEANGADVLSRMIHACRIALSIGFLATGIALLIGVVVGGVMGYFAGAVDLVGMRIVEVFSAIPTFFLILTLVAVLPPEWNAYRLYLIMVIIGLTGWVGYARFIRAEFLRLRQQDFIVAARACGLPLRSILFRHMLPNGVAPVLVEASFGVAGAILSESTLSFLGLGLVDEPSWGQMLSEAVSGTGSFKWWMAIFPGGAIFLTVFAYNLIGEALRDAIDPHLQRASQL